MKNQFFLFLATAVFVSNVLASDEEALSRLMKSNDFEATCKYAVELARRESSYNAYYFAAGCKERHASLKVTDQEYLNWITLASKNNLNALSKLGDLYASGQYVKGDPTIALVIYLQVRKRADNQSAIDRLTKKITFLELQTDCKKNHTTVFNHKIKCSKKNKLDEAIVQAGGVLKERNGNISIFKSQNLLKDSNTLSVYYTTKNQFACLEYSFTGFSFEKPSIASKITGMIVDKYGRTDNNQSRYRKNSMKWSLDDGISITIKSDYLETRLRYCHPAYEKIMLSELDNLRKAKVHANRVKQDNAF